VKAVREQYKLSSKIEIIDKENEKFSLKSSKIEQKIDNESAEVRKFTPFSFVF